MTHKIKIRNQHHARYDKKDNEQIKEPSKTVPGQSMTILEMVQRHRKGLPIDESTGALYQGEEDLPDISNMDLIDRQAYIDSVADALVEVKERLKEAHKSKADKELIDKVEAEVQIRLKQMQTKKSSIEEITPV